MVHALYLRRSATTSSDTRHASGDNVCRKRHTLGEGRGGKHFSQGYMQSSSIQKKHLISPPSTKQCPISEPSPSPREYFDLDFMAGRSSSASLPSSSQGSRLVRTFTKGDATKALGPIETREFSEEMLSVVWVIDVGFIDSDNQKLGFQGTGFCIHPEGYILTAAHLFHERMTDILIRKYNDTYFRSSADGHVRMVKKFDSLDVAVIKVEFSREGDENGFNYASFGDGALFRGQEVMNISHTRRWVYTAVRGEICYPCVNNITRDENSMSVKDAHKIEIDVCTAWHRTPAYRKARDVVDPANKNLNWLRTDLPLIQINNIHGFNGSSGSPVFNATGQVIGMIIFVDSNMDFAVHVSVLKNLLKTAMENYKKKTKQKQTNEKGGKRKFQK